METPVLLTTSPPGLPALVSAPLAQVRPTQPPPPTSPAGHTSGGETPAWETAMAGHSEMYCSGSSRRDRLHVHSDVRVPAHLQEP